MGEQVAVGDADAKCIGGTVGEALYSYVCQVHDVATERLRQRLVDEVDIGAVLAEQHIPRLAARLRREQYEPSRIGELQERSQAMVWVAARAVQHQH